jgi:hypothetical protein
VSPEDRQFLDGVLSGHPHDRFGHAEHIRLAFLLVSEHGLSTGSDMVYEAIQRLACAHGNAKKFHATLSSLWPRLIAAHMKTGDCDFSTFIEREAILLDKRLPLRFYSPARLGSPSARKRYVEPDRADLPRIFNL